MTIFVQKMVIIVAFKYSLLRVNSFQLRGKAQGGGGDTILYVKYRPLWQSKYGNGNAINFNINKQDH